MNKWRKKKNGILIYHGEKYTYAIGNPSIEIFLLIESGTMRTTLVVKDVATAKQIVKLLEG